MGKVVEERGWTSI